MIVTDKRTKTDGVVVTSAAPSHSRLSGLFLGNYLQH